MRKLRLVGIPVFALIWVLAVVSIAVASHDSEKTRFEAALSGYQEVPAVSTTGRGTILLELQDGQIAYTLTYSDLEGGTVTAAHIHFGQRSVNGGVIAFFCGGGGRPACTTPSGTFSGTILPENVIGPVGAQQVTPGSLDEVVRALRAGLVYANVHSMVSPGGEIRGQVNDRNQRGEDDHDDGDDD